MASEYLNPLCWSSSYLNPIAWGVANSYEMSPLPFSVIAGIEGSASDFEMASASYSFVVTMPAETLTYGAAATAYNMVAGPFTTGMTMSVIGMSTSGAVDFVVLPFSTAVTINPVNLVPTRKIIPASVSVRMNMLNLRMVAGSYIDSDPFSTSVSIADITITRSYVMVLDAFSITTGVYGIAGPPPAKRRNMHRRFTLRR